MIRFNRTPVNNAIENLLQSGAKYLKPTRKALESKVADAALVKPGKIVDAPVLKLFEGNKSVHVSTAKRTSDGRWIGHERIEYGNGSVVSYTSKRSKNGVPYETLVRSDIGEDGKRVVVEKVSQQGDRFVAKVPKCVTVDGKRVRSFLNYDTAPSKTPNVIEPNEITQKFLKSDVKKWYDSYFSKMFELR